MFQVRTSPLTGGYSFKLLSRYLITEFPRVFKAVFMPKSKTKLF